MKFKLLFVCLVAMCVQAFAVAQQQKNNGWQPYYHDDKVQIEYRFAGCDLPSQGTNKEMVFIQVKNLTNSELKVSYELELQYGDNCYNCAGGDLEFYREIILKPHSTLTGECKDDSNKQLEIFSKFNNMANRMILENHKVKNVVVKEINHR